MLVMSACTIAETRPEIREFTIYNENTARVSYQVEIADTDSSRRRGLMFRESLPANSGMLLKYNSARKVAIWMKNTYVPLDLLFIDEKGSIVKIHKGAVPLSTDSIHSGQRVESVLEINSGQVDEHSIQLGDKLRRND